MGQRKYIPKGSRLIVVACAFLLLRTYASGDIVKDVCDGEFLIEDGNYYDYVNVWDSATVTMIGGEVLYLQGFDSSILDYSGGHAWNIYICQVTPRPMSQLMSANRFILITLARCIFKMDLLPRICLPMTIQNFMYMDTIFPLTQIVLLK